MVFRIERIDVLNRFHNSIFSSNWFRH